MVVEVPRWACEKMSISLNEPLNPIKHEINNNTIKYIPNVHPHDAYLFNYGALPETWAHPEDIDPHTSLKGDGHPIDVMEIGERIAKRGEILQVKVLGAMGVIDNGIIDWKIIAINTNDSEAANLNDIGEFETLYPGFMEGVKDWFEEFKVLDGKPNSKLAFKGEIQNRELAYKVIETAWKSWMRMMLKKKEDSPVPDGVLTFEPFEPQPQHWASLFARPDNDGSGIVTIRTIARGIPKTRDYRIFHKSELGFMSAFHDIPLYANKRERHFNMVVEMPRYTHTKMKMSMNESLNPVKGKDPESNPCYTLWNYGFLPQTWENSNTTDPNTGRLRDGEPIDVIDIGDVTADRGEVIPVKILGAIGLVDKERIDYKIIAINVDDPRAGRLHDIDDVEVHFPGYINDTIAWFMNHRSKGIHVFKVKMTHDMREKEEEPDAIQKPYYTHGTHGEAEDTYKVLEAEDTNTTTTTMHTEIILNMGNLDYSSEEGDEYEDEEGGEGGGEEEKEEEEEEERRRRR
ncbi:hypothetical protein WDU94_000366 [Cyamophila willieti]